MFILLAAEGATGGMSTVIMILLFIAIFYFFLIRPQQKQQKQMEEFRNNLGKGDKITTVGGIHGKIVGVKEKTFQVEIAKGIVIELEKTAINYQANGNTPKKDPVKPEENDKNEEPSTPTAIDEDRNPNLD